MRALPASIAERIPHAAEVFAERGFDSTRVDDLADATGVPRATLYYYFDGKEDILAHLLGTMLSQLAAAVREAVSTAGDAATRLGLVIRAQLRVMARNPAVCKILLAELGRAGRLPDIAAGLRAGFHEPVRELLEQGRRDGSIRDDVEPDLAVSAIYGATLIPGLHRLVLDDRLEPDADGAAVTDLLMRGLAAPTPIARRRASG